MERGDPQKLFRKYARKLGIPLVVALVVLPFALIWARHDSWIGIVIATAAIIVAVVTGLFFLLVAMFAGGDKLNLAIQRKTEGMLKGIGDDRERSISAMMITKALWAAVSVGLCLVVIALLHLWQRRDGAARPLLPRWSWIALLVLIGIQIIGTVAWFIYLRIRHRKGRGGPSEPPTGPGSGEADGG
jgi:hypothetical protein